MENQYLSSVTIGDAMAARLREKEGPEIILVLPQETSEWLEQMTMTVLRSRLLKRLRAVDRFRRLHVYYPIVEDERVQVRVHSKICIVDDKLLRVGSANLNNRSMGLDTECDLAIEVVDRAMPDTIAALRNRLLAEHLGVSAEKVAQEHRTTGSLARAIENLRGGQRSLGALDGAVSEALDGMVPEAAVVDPERPLDPDQLMQEFIPTAARRRAAPGLVRLAVMLLCLAAIACVWRWTFLLSYVEYASLTAWTAALTDSPLAPLWMAALFTLGTFILIPVTLLIIATGAAFGPALGFSYALWGASVSALASYGLGRLAGRETVRRFAGSRLSRVQRQISRHGFLSMLFARVVPIAPFVVVNLIAGAVQIRLRDFFLGTVLGMSPGIFAIVVLESQLQRALRDPAIGNIALLIGLAIFFALLGIAFYRWYSARRVPAL